MTYYGPTGTRAAKIVAREHFAWPGGYAMALVTADGGELCPECVRAEFRQIAASYLHGQTNSGWYPAGIVHTGETDDDLVCDHCGRTIN